MRKIIMIFALLLLFTFSTFVAEKQMSIIVNGEEVLFTSLTGYPYEDENDVIMVPALPIAAALDANFSASNLSDHFMLNKNQVFINLVLEENFIDVSGTRVYSKTAPQLRNGIVYIPLKIIVSEMNYMTVLDEETYTYEIYLEGQRQGIHYDDSDIPVNEYKVIYFDTRSPNEIVATEYTDLISLNYPSEKYNIPAENFGARWVGLFEFDKSTEKVIRIDESWASTTLLIDGMPVYDGPYTFTPGEHKIECEFSSNWHAITFLVNIIDPEVIVPSEELSSSLKQLITPKTKFEYVGVNESNGENQEIEVSLKKNNQNEELILFLSSYNAINWKITNPNDVKIKAIIYNSYSSGTTVNIIGAGDTMILKCPDLIDMYKIYPDYMKVGHSYHIENDDFPRLIDQVKMWTDSLLDGCTVKYSAEILELSEVVLNEVEYDKINKSYDEMYKIVNAPPQRLDNLFGKESMTNSWGDSLNLKKSVPTGVFKAYYFNTKDPSVAIESELIDEPKLTYSWSDFSGIPSEEFGAYYVGLFEYDKTVTQEFIINHSQAYSRVIIDGEVIWRSWDSNEQSFEYIFTKGSHVIEFEYMNDWHTTDYMMMIRDGSDKKNIEQVNEFIEKNIDNETKIYWVNDYNSSGLYYEGKLDFTNVTGDVFLILNAYNPIQWGILDTKTANVKGILYTGRYDGSKIINNSGKEIPIIYGEYFLLGLDYPENDTETLSLNSAQYKEFEEEVFTKLSISKIDGFRITSGNTHIFKYEFRD